MNGSNPGNSEVFLDGAPASQGNVRGGIQENGPAVEQVGEFSVVTNSFNAEYGRTGSWFTNITIRSGTNQIHGSAFDFFDNDALNARSFFQQIRSTVRHNEGGFTLGAPVYLPKIYNGRNKTFFFFGQQLVYYTNTNSGSLFTVPRADFRTGDFSQLLDSTNVQIPIFDPLTTQAGRQGRLRARAVPRQRISRQPDQPGIAEDGGADPAARPGNRSRSTISATAPAPEPTGTTFPPSRSITAFRTPTRCRSRSATSTTRA